MADSLGTENYAEFSSIPILFTKTAVAAAGNQGLNDIVLPALADSTITRAMLELVVISMVPQNNLHANLQDGQEIQIKEAAGAYIDAILLIDDGLKCPTDGAMNIRVLGSIDVIAQVDAFGQTFNVQWKDLNVEGDDVDFEVYCILKVWYSIDSGVVADLSVIEALARSVQEATTIVPGAVVADGGNTPSTFKTNLTAGAYADDWFNNLQIVMRTGTDNEGQARRISDYDDTTGFVTVDTAFDNTPADADLFTIVSRFTGTGSVLTPATIADAVWDEAVPGARTPGQAGRVLGDIEDDVDDILDDTGTTLPAQITAHDTDIKTLIGTPTPDLVTDIQTAESNIRGSDSDDLKDISDQIDGMQTDVSTIEGKLPDNNIMGSGVKTDKDDEIDDIKTAVETTIPAQITTHDTDIKALPSVKATPKYLVVPSGNTRIEQEGGIDDAVVTIPVYDVSTLQTYGVILFESEYITYTGISVDNELTGCTRGAYGSSPASHADHVQGYEVLVYPLRLMVHDNELNMLAPDAAPTIEIVDWNGNQELAPLEMTLISTGLYGYNYKVAATDTPEPKTLRFSITTNAITTLRQSTLMLNDEPASQVDLMQIVGGGTGEFVCNQDGYFDSSNIFQAWTDVMVGYLRDATSGSRLDDVLVTAYKVINGQTVVAKIPPGQVVCDNNGNYELRLDEGTYTFKFHKDQYRFPTDEVERTVTP